jgi:uncharacterized protein (TIGR02996 family)
MLGPMSALGDSVDGWRRTKHPRWAALAEVAAEEALRAEPRVPIAGAKKKDRLAAWGAVEKARDPLDLQRLVRGMREELAGDATEQLRKLAKWDDPRLVTEVLGLLRDPPWRSHAYKGFVFAAIDLLLGLHDPRVRPALEELAAGYKGILETSVGDWVSKELLRAAGRAKDVTPAEPKGAVLARLEATFARQLQERERARAVRANASASDDEFLAAIYAAPDDDAPRLVYADLLTERGDPRGELIVLQTLASPTPAQSKRIAEILGDAKRVAAFGLPLSRGGSVKIRRGFTDEIDLARATAKDVLGDRAFATVMDVGVGRISTKLALEFLEHPTLAHVRRVSPLDVTLQKKLPRRERSWTHVIAKAFPPRDLLSTWPHLVSLESTSDEKVPFEPDRLALVPKLEELEINAEFPLTRAHFEAAPGLRKLKLFLWRHEDLPPGMLAPLLRLEELELQHPTEDARVFEGLPLTKLEVGGVKKFDPRHVRAILAGVPTVRHLGLRLQACPWKLVPLLDAIEGTRVESLTVHGWNIAFTVEGTHAEISFVQERGAFDEVFGEAIRKERVTRFSGDRWAMPTVVEALAAYGLSPEPPA